MCDCVCSYFSFLIQVTMFSVGTTYLCYDRGWETDMPLSLIGAAIIFPVSFGYCRILSHSQFTTRVRIGESI